MRLQAIIVTLILSTITLSCSPVFESELNQLSDLKIELKEAQTKIEGLNTNKAKDIKQMYFEVTSKVDKLYEPDSSGLDQHYARMRNYYKGIKKVAGSFTDSPIIVLQEIATTTTQIEMLESDIKEGAIKSKDSVSIFVEDEKKFVSDHVKQVNAICDNFSSYQAVHDSAYPYFVHILDSLKKIK